jgi:exopolysaccharide production protein ExoQ
MIVNRASIMDACSVENSISRLYRNALLALFLLPQFIQPLLPILSGNLDQTLADSSANPVWQAIVGFVLLSSVLLSFVFRVQLRRIIWVLWPMIPMSLWIFLSYSWSAYPDLTLRRGIRFVAELASVAILGLTFKDRKDIVKVLYWTFFLVNVLDVGSLAVPSLSFTSIGFGGVHLNKNLAGLFFFISLPVFALGAMDRSISSSRLLALFACVTAMAMLGLTLSKSAMGVGLLALSLVFLSKVITSRDPRLRVITAIIGFLVAGIAVLIILDLGVSQILSILFGDSSLTGRDKIWRYALYKFDQNEWLGTGYGALWQVGAEIKTALQDVGVHMIFNEAHNGYIDILAQLGYPGLFFLVVFIVVTFIRLFKVSSASMGGTAFDLNDYALYLLWGAVIYNITESSFFRVGHNLWTMLVLISAVVIGTDRRRANKLVMGGMSLFRSNGRIISDHQRVS